MFLTLCLNLSEPDLVEHYYYSRFLSVLFDTSYFPVRPLRLTLSVPVCLSLTLPVPVCLTLTLPVQVCLSLTLHVSVCLLVSLSLFLSVS